MLPLLIPAGLSAAIGHFLGRKAAKLANKEGLKSNLSSHFNKPVSIQIIREYIVSEETMVLATEDIPLDNRYGSQSLTSEHEFIRTASISLDIDRSREVGTSLRTGFWKAFETRASGELSKSLGVKVGSQVSRRVRLRFSVAPHKGVRYRIVWKQESRRGEFEVLVGDKKKYRIPYMITYGLSHSVESLLDGRFADISELDSGPKPVVVVEDGQQVGGDDNDQQE
ncbi:MAG: hypothetical protein HQL72_03980 [Magnetococcales bacterium]|nr:hypothetical protein [Magnetococcales bacterium]